MEKVSCYAISADYASWRALLDDEADQADVTVTVTEKRPGHFIIEADQYYFKDGICRLEITQPFERAMHTFLGLLRIDDGLERVENNNRFWDNVRRNRG